MKTLGLIGGMTWLSTVEYYRIINQQVNERLGGANSAKIFLYTVNFEEFKPPADWDGWIKIADALSGISKKLEEAGADCIVICSNTPHIIADLVQQNIKVPLINIAGETSKEIAKKKFNTVALLGTKFTMEQTFFKDQLSRLNITALIPGEKEREFIHTSIYTEFGKGIFREETKRKYLNIIDDLKSRGAEGVIFGCTEIPLLIKQKECSLPILDTTLIHATAAVDFALKDYTNKNINHGTDHRN
jgi:aspartate racemase